LKVEPPFESYFRYLTNYDVIISGHFHLNKICRYNYKGQEKIVVFLGEQTDESLQYLQVDAANVKPIFELKEFR
ncbi:MAG: hypothetical protein HY606_04055, partial [Planctomycetes bacterium]|nr:hypothetical protein [Planctomycetota bacterium]